MQRFEFTFTSGKTHDLRIRTQQRSRPGSTCLCVGSPTASQAACALAAAASSCVSSALRCTARSRNPGTNPATTPASAPGTTPNSAPIDPWISRPVAAPATVKATTTMPAVSAGKVRPHPVHIPACTAVPPLGPTRSSHRQPASLPARRLRSRAIGRVLTGCVSDVA